MASSSSSTVAVLGLGIVGRTLATGWARAGHDVVLGSREPGSDRIGEVIAAVRAAAAEAGQSCLVSAALPAQAARAGDVVVVTVPGDQVAGLVATLDGALAGKTVIDATNNLADGGALNGLQVLQAAGGSCYRAFCTIGWEQMARPMFGRLRADLPYTGPDGAGSRDGVEALIRDIGFRPIHLGEDAGAVEALDSLARLWFRLAFSRGYGRRVAIRFLTSEDDE